MKKWIGLVSVVLFAVACQKEVSIDSLNGGGGSGGGGNSSGSLIGTWKFIGLSANTESIVTITDMGETIKSVTTSAYSSTNNTGTYTFTANKATSAGIGYSINSMAETLIYLNGVIEDTIQFPFTANLPPSNGEATYKKVGTDSLYFESGSFAIPSYGTQPTQPSGVKYRFSGDTLFLISNNSQSVTITDAGATQKTDSKVSGIVKLLKQ